jgi:hypothetical protein
MNAGKRKAVPMIDTPKDKMRAILKELGYINDTQPYKTFSAEELLNMFTNPTLVKKTHQAVGMLREIECPACGKNVLVRANRKGFIQLCSFECRKRYAQTVIFTYSFEELNDINSFLLHGDFTSVFAIIKKKADAQKVHGLCAFLSQESGVPDHVFSQVLLGHNVLPTGRTILKFLKVCGISLAVK